MSDPDIILVSQSNVVDYDAYSKLPLDRLDLFKSLVYPRMVRHEGEFRSHLDYLNFKTHGKAYAAADYSERRRMLNIWIFTVGQRRSSRELSFPIRIRSLRHQ
jgi:anaerobic magnesium-protoporphyrin IX monomethyl ester cyclase